MKWIALLAAKLAVFAAVLYGLHALSQLNHRSVTAWTTQRHEDVGKPVARGRGVPFASEQRPVTAPRSCADQTWPKITPECITGQAQAARPAPVAPVQAAPDSGLPPDAPAAAPAALATAEPPDPPHTGSLPTAASEAIRKPAQARQASAAPPRESPRTARLRNRRLAAPPARVARWAAAPRPSFFYAQRRSPRMASMPWTNSNQNWRDGRPE
jgi:hypothetical protein